MAATQYQIFCRYVSEHTNKAISNKNPIKWFSKEEYNKLDIEQQAYYESIRANESDYPLQNKTVIVEECKIEPLDSTYSSDSDVRKMYIEQKNKRELDDYEIIVEQSDLLNPKYDMIFMYKGIVKMEAATGDLHPAPSSTVIKKPYLYYEKMERLQMDPWFLYSTHASLNSAMAKAKELVNLLGKDAVKIGKVVPLEQYITIV